MKGLYKSANKTLTEKATSSERARERAQQLLNKASRITVDTNEKLNELKGKILISIKSYKIIKNLNLQKWLP